MSKKTIEKAVELVSRTGSMGRHTFYQLKHFVLGKEVTTQAKMWKCVREIEARVASAKSMKNSIEEAEDDAKMIELRINFLEKKKPKSAIDKECKEIKVRKLKRRKASLEDSLAEMKKRLAETEEEMEFFLAAYGQMEAMEPLASQDDMESNASYWDQNLARELHLRLMLQKPLDLELVKCILALDDSSSTKNEMLGILDQIHRAALGEKRRIEKEGGKVEKNF